MNVQRDPFARQSLLRRTYTYGTCAWCGQKPRRLYTYTLDDDASGTRRSAESSKFCSLDCYRSYCN